MSTVELKNPITITGRHLALLMGSLTHAIEANHEESDRYKKSKDLLARVGQAREAGDSFIMRDARTAAIANGAMRTFSIVEYSPSGFISRTAKDLSTEGRRYSATTREEVNTLFHFIKDEIDESLAARR